MEKATVVRRRGGMVVVRCGCGKESVLYPGQGLAQCERCGLYHDRDGREVTPPREGR